MCLEQKRKRKRILKISTVFLAGLLFSAAALFPVSAEVFFSKEAAGYADSIYVAGNPDFYPVEYYNSKTESYEGIIPELLKSVSEATGVDFTYVSAGEKDQRDRLAKNGQVEIVSAYLMSDSETAAYSSGEKIILSVPMDGQFRDVCFIFTEIASNELIRAVTTAIDEIPDNKLTEIAISYMMEHQHDRFPTGTLWVVLILLGLAAAAVILFSVQLHKQKKEKQQNKFLDPATGIGNKAYFIQHFDNAISDQSRVLYSVAYIAFDVAHVNQYYGYDESENILYYAANILTQNAADTDIVAKNSAGGFVLAYQSSNKADAQERIERLLHLLNQYSETYRRDFRIVFCAGIYPLTQNDRNCETAVYNALQGYRYALANRLPYFFCNDELLKNTEKTALLLQQITSAFKNHEFRVYIQFIIDKNTKKICGAEALSRWQHPQKGLLSPVHYIDVMEKAGNISKLDFYIFEKVCEQLQIWESGSLKQISLSCNFTRITISDENFTERIKQIAEKFVFDRSKLIIEITEDATESNEDMAFCNIAECKKMGFSIALDDMGDGYTSFTNLSDYPIDIIKIDKRIVKNVETSNGKALLEGMIALGHSMNMKVLCEGVETERQNNLICLTDCDLIQGYYYTRPIPLEETAEFLKKHKVFRID